MLNTVTTTKRPMRDRTRSDTAKERTMRLRHDRRTKAALFLLVAFS